MKWSFDDLHIGLMPERGTSLATREIARPAGIAQSDWYVLAQNTCRLLNINERIIQRYSRESP